ncbi:MAG: phosphoenolpyruvate--protein phosphotransferase [Candidatus Hodarchaeales archaeon]
MKTLAGISASPGVAIGKALIYNKKNLLDLHTTGILQDLSSEQSIKLFKTALAKAIQYLEKIKEKTEHELGSEEAAIFDAQILILEDEDYQTAVIKQLKEGIQLDKAIWNVIDYYVKKFEKMDNQYFKERAADIKDVGNQLMNALSDKRSLILSNLDHEAIIVSQELSPSDTVEMRREKVLGFATELGGSTSHVAIIAKSLNLPAVVGIPGLIENVTEGQFLIVDGINGRIIINPDSETFSKYRTIQHKLLDNERGLKKYAKITAKTLDGIKIEVQANVGSLHDIDPALGNGADGMGLLRTEFLYLGRNVLPTEEDLYSIVKKILLKMGDKPVIFRTLDIGGDKDIPSLNLPTESNPFLGLRGSRIIIDSQLKNVIITQIRAALRASKFGNLKLMFPMITTLKELLELNNITEDCKTKLKEEGHEFSDKMELGIMVEVPSAAICADVLAPYVDFFSIGTNDLTQYTLASDRTNEAIASLYDHYHPSIFRLIRQVVEAAQKYGKWVGVCGEMANETLATPILIGLGVTELSMNPSSIPKVKKKITNLRLKDCRELVDTVLNLTDPSEVRKYLAQNLYDLD